MPAQTEHFFTGMLALESTENQTNTASVSLKRGMARFDLAVESIEEVSVKNVTVRNLANSAYLFPQESIQSPSNANRKDTTVVFQQPITDGKLGMLYVYEQENQSIEISATVVIGGKEEILTKAVDGPLKKEKYRLHYYRTSGSPRHQAERIVRRMGRRYEHRPYALQTVMLNASCKFLSLNAKLKKPET